MKCHVDERIKVYYFDTKSLEHAAEFKNIRNIIKLNKEKIKCNQLGKEG